MDLPIIAAGGGILAAAFFYWRLSQANKSIGRLKSEASQKDAAYDALMEQAELLAARIRDLGGTVPDGVRIDPATGGLRRP